MRGDTPIAAAFVACVALLAASRPQPVHCSSYLDDYFLPTAKMALNKLQQTLSPSPKTSEQPVGTEVTNASGSGNFVASRGEVKQAQDQILATTTTTAASYATPTSEPSTGASFSATTVDQPIKPATEQVTPKIKTNQDERQPNELREPDRSEFVVLGANLDDSSSVQREIQNVNQSPKQEATEAPVAATVSETVTPEAVSVISSTQATEVDPTTSVSVAAVEPVSESAEANTIPSEDLQPKLLPQQQQQEEPVVVVGGSESAATQTQSNKANGKTPEELAKEAEVEAIAAVEASIGFSQLGGTDPFGSMADICYDEYGNARFCEPEFENVAFERPVVASNECGTPPSRFCTAHPTERNNRNCHVCDTHHPKKRHPAGYLTDLNNSNAPTCWVSAPMDSAGALNMSASGELRADNVTLELNLDKKYEITYISMQFCSPKPDSLAIYKSGDFGQTWTPYQFYSSQCRRLYSRHSGRLGARGLDATTSSQQQQPQQQPEASCQDASLSGAAGRVAFSTLDGRQAGQGQLERSANLQDWVTATNIKVVLDRHQAAWIQANQLAPHQHHQVAPRNGSLIVATPDDGTATSESSLTSPSDTYNYAMSDLTVGGRCKCNGHASRCIHGPDGRLQCDCRHNTAGRDCEKCAQLHFDRPWARATQLDANPCQPCNCNGHTRKCRFDAELFQLSGRRSGGVCIQCKDNTAGRHCHYCKEGFTRDHSKPMSDKEACKPCNCHPVGSLGRACNQTTGQCPCKEGVTGLECSRCAAGYQQSSSPSEPCIKLPENDINYEPSLAVDGGGDPDDQQPGLLVATGSPNGENPTDEAPSIADFGRLPTPSNGARSHDRPLPDDGGSLDQAIDKQQEDQDQDLEADRLNGRSRARGQWPPPPQSRKHNFYLGGSRYQSHRRPMDSGDDDEMDLEAHKQARLRPPIGAQPDDDYAYPTRHYPAYPTPTRDRQFGGHEYRRRNGGQRGWQLAAGGGGGGSSDPTIANLEPGNEELGQPEDQLGAGRGYAIESIYNQDAYNSIQSPSLRRTQHHHAASRMHRPSVAQAAAAAAVPVVATNSISCGDCQSNTRRLGRRQFCHLDYAIKAATLRRQVSDDWTKFEIEIQDIFKSPASSLVRPAAAAAAGSSDDIDNLLQADEPVFGAASIGANKTADSLVVDSPQQSAAQLHRFKVGTVQTVWIPTEDISCKCPKLKPGFTYLMMGSVDLRNDSPNSIQLDRHGVALEWKPSFLGKLTKYRVRHEKGRC